MTDNDAHEHWSARLGEIATEVGVPGAALAVWADGSETAVSHGVLSTATGVEVTPDSLFQIGSITKLWTATMIMQLVEEGRLTLDSTVADVLPGVRLGVADASRETTVRHLLTHTSGLDGDVFTDTGRGDDCVQRYVEMLADVPRNHPLGTAYSYCNSGFVVLGRMVEVLDGRTWDESLRARLVVPLGLADTVTLPEEVILHRAAVGHREHPHERDSVPVWNLPRSVGPAGLIVSTVHDVVAFARMHVNGGLADDGTRVLGADSAAAMRQPQYAIPSIDDRGDAVGLAWRLNTWGGRRIVGHDGGTIGQLAYLRVDPEARVVACLLTNSSVSQALYERIFAEVFDHHLGVTPPPAPTPIEQPVTADLARHVGRYEHTARRYDVTLRGDTLHVVSTTTGELAALSEGPDECDLHPADTSGNAFAVRIHDEEPWNWLAFDAFPDGTPYLYLGGRAVPLVSRSAE